MRVDHYAIRVPNREEAVKFYTEALGYRVQQEFEVSFEDGTTAMCSVLEPGEKPLFHDGTSGKLPWTLGCGFPDVSNPNNTPSGVYSVLAEYHLAPEVFISEGTPGSVVDKWVKARGGLGGLHHIAMQVPENTTVRDVMLEWAAKGWADFTTEDVLKCPDDDLHQVFTKPNKYTGVIFEFIKRGKDGFCNKNVKDLMTSTKDLS